MSPNRQCLPLIRDVTNIINYKCLSKRKIAKFRQFFIFSMYSITLFRTLSETLPLYISKLREDGYYRELRIDADVLDIHF